MYESHGQDFPLYIKNFNIGFLVKVKCYHLGVYYHKYLSQIVGKGVSKVLIPLEMYYQNITHYN